MHTVTEHIKTCSSVKLIGRVIVELLLLGLVSRWFAYSVSQ